LGRAEGKGLTIGDGADERKHISKFKAKDVRFRLMFG
jgi:hypothetical protein